MTKDNLSTTRNPFLTKAIIAKVEKALAERYGRHMDDGERFQLTGDSNKDAWTLCVTFENADRSLHLPVEMALAVADNPKTSNDEARAILIDFADYYFGRYFKEARNATLPIDWATFPFGDYTVLARGWERNLLLEEAADRLLAGESVEEILPNAK